MPFARSITLILIFIIPLSACDKGKKPYEEAEALLNQSNWLQIGISSTEQAITEKNYKKAIKSYEDILILDPKSAILLFWATAADCIK